MKHIVLHRPALLNDLSWVDAGTEVEVGDEPHQITTARATDLVASEGGLSKTASDNLQKAPPLQPVDGPAAAVLVTINGGSFTVTAPWLDSPESFGNAEAAEARQAQLREAGPPEGWKDPLDHDGDGRKGGSLSKEKRGQ